jgi:hypothetical protein
LYNGNFFQLDLLIFIALVGNAAFYCILCDFFHFFRFRFFDIFFLLLRKLVESVVVCAKDFFFLPSRSLRTIRATFSWTFVVGSLRIYCLFVFFSFAIFFTAVMRSITTYVLHCIWYNNYRHPSFILFLHLNYFHLHLILLCKIYKVHLCMFLLKFVHRLSNAKKNHRSVHSN